MATDDFALSEEQHWLSSALGTRLFLQSECHRIIKVGKTSKNTKPSLQPNTTVPTKPYWEVTHLFFKHFQGFPGKPVPMLQSGPLGVTQWEKYVMKRRKIIVGANLVHLSQPWRLPTSPHW